MIESGKHRWGTIVIGGSQSGLAMGYYLKKIGEDFIVLDASEKVGQTWSNRWDSLQLFSPPSVNKMPGWSFPSPKGGPDTKDEMAEYLAAYARKFDLPIKSGYKVISVSKNGSVFSVVSAEENLTAERVIIATGAHQFPYIPAFAADLSSDIFQVHSDHYRRPSALPPGDVLVVGSAISGMQIALEVIKDRKTTIAGKPTYIIPRGLSQISKKLDWWLLENLLTIKTPMGRKVRPQFVKGGGVFPYLVQEIKESTISLRTRLSGVKDKMPMLENGETIATSVIIWCTGHRPNFSWIKECVTDERGWPVTERGVSAMEGLYFIGMPFQYGLTSSLISGVRRDAEYISDKIRAHRQSNKILD
jgi:putative flavoprotein involved in K+ transport